MKKQPESESMPDSHPEREEPPPILGSWGRLYAAVVVYTIVFILLLYWITIALNR